MNRKTDASSASVCARGKMRDEKTGTKRLAENGGFTLIETLLALFLLVVALIPLAAILTGALRESTVDKARAHAREIAESERDKIKSLTFNAIGLTTAPYTFNNAPSSYTGSIQAEAGYTGSSPGPETQTVQNFTYTVTRDIRRSPDQYAGNTYTKKVIITVSWTVPAPGSSVSVTTEIGPTAMAP